MRLIRSKLLEELISTSNGLQLSVKERAARHSTDVYAETWESPGPEDLMDFLQKAQGRDVTWALVNMREVDPEAVFSSGETRLYMWLGSEEEAQGRIAERLKVMLADEEEAAALE